MQTQDVRARREAVTLMRPLKLCLATDAPFSLYFYLHTLRPHAFKRGIPCQHSREVRSHLRTVGAGAATWRAFKS